MAHFPILSVQYWYTYSVEYGENSTTSKYFPFRLINKGKGWILSGRKLSNVIFFVTDSERFWVESNGQVLQPDHEVRGGYLCQVRLSGTYNQFYKSLEMDEESIKYKYQLQFISRLKQVWLITLNQRTKGNF